MFSRHAALAALCLGAALAAAPGAARAEPMMKGKDLVVACVADAASAQRRICLGYIAAVHDALEAGGVAGRKACFPPDTKLSVMRDVVVEHLTKQAKNTDEKPGSDGVTVALVNRFACK